MGAGLNEISSTQVIKGLGASHPDPELAEKLKLFGQFVGDWEIDGRWIQPDGTEIRGRGEVHFGWILNGRAVQDVWISHKANSPADIPVGTTVRFYDPKIDAWQCVWIAPAYGIVRTFVAREVGDEIVLEGHTAEGYPERWIYSKITPRSFHWRAIESHDGEKTWRLTEEMQIQRTDESR